MAMKKPKFMIVRWMDASSDTEWKDGEESVHDPVICWTSGWFVGEDAERLVLTQTITSDGGRGHEWSIPIGCIQRRRVVKSSLP